MPRSPCRPLRPEDRMQPLFASQEEYDTFNERQSCYNVKTAPLDTYSGNCYLGIDAGSTTTKFVLLSDNEEILNSFYAPNEGDPLKVAKQALIDLRERYKESGAELEILSAALNALPGRSRDMGHSEVVTL